MKPSKKTRKRLWLIWDFANSDWLRQSLNGKAILAFEKRRDAWRAAKRMWGFRCYSECKRAGYCEVLEVTSGGVKEVNRG